MNEKIKKALGDKADEIAKLLKDAGIELAVANDGSFVPADKFDANKAEIAKLTKTINEMKKAEDDKKAAEQNKKADEEKANQTYEQKLAAMQKQFDDYKAGVESEKSINAKKSALEKKLKAENCQPSAIKLIIAATNFDKLELNEKGEVKDEFMTGLKTDTPDLFGVKTSESEKTPFDTGKDGKIIFTREMVENMSQEEVNEHYDAIMESGVLSK